MNPLLSFLAEKKTLGASFVGTVVISCLFPLAQAHWQLTLLDGIVSPADARALVDGFTAEQRNAHAWITATLDVAYPLAYGGFFAGSAARVFTQYGGRLGWLALAAVPMDLAEGVVQVLALTGTADLLGAKAVVTPAKFLLFLAGIGTAAAAWATWLYRRVSARS